MKMKVKKINKIIIFIIIKNFIYPKNNFSIKNYI